MPSDQQALQGLWRVESCIARGSPVATVTTHYAFEGNKFKEIDPSKVDGGRWSTFKLDAKARPKRLTITSKWPGAGGRSTQRVDHLLYELKGSNLRICWPSVFGEYPDEFSENRHEVDTLVRHKGPPPATKQPSGKKPIKHAVLGRLKWDDDLDNWVGQVALKTGGEKVELMIETGGRADADAVEDAQSAVQWLRKHEPAARKFVASRLLDAHNSSRNDGKSISERTFASRLTLESATVNANGVLELDFDDGDLFGGHWINVVVNAQRQFEDAEVFG